ncbi:hypothetical protein [Paenibacillus mendelii]|uniref:Uncharacterized protein n=1 Tax=Paenibacillus mendelii TaxID=206163 RepID=A0ABV6JJS9_9BACL|nr:hypothetical protein [Paenibacillus mendelii]MCQ6559097.1 hypothetical protein [Paenibacillus mendelii]
MDKKKLNVLKKLYGPTNYKYDAEREVRLYKEESLTDSERELLREMDWAANQLERLTHDSCLYELIKLRNDSRLTRERIMEGFIAGVGGSYPRGLSSLVSYYTMMNIPTHPYQEADKYAACKICSFSADQKDGFWENISQLKYVLYLGNAYGSSPWGALIDLKEITELPPIEATKDDVVTFNQLLFSLARSHEGETPGEYEKRLSSEKIMPKNKYVRRGILNSLAIVGVAPNVCLPNHFNKWTDYETMVSQEEKLGNTKGRSDMEIPWAAWKGELKINRDIAKELFGEKVNAL